MLLFTPPRLWCFVIAALETNEGSNIAYKPNRNSLSSKHQGKSVIPEHSGVLRSTGFEVKLPSSNPNSAIDWSHQPHLYGFLSVAAFHPSVSGMYSPLSSLTDALYEKKSRDVVPVF